METKWSIADLPSDRSMSFRSGYNLEDVGCLVLKVPIASQNGIIHLSNRQGPKWACVDHRSRFFHKDETTYDV